MNALEIVSIWGSYVYALGKDDDESESKESVFPKLPEMPEMRVPDMPEMGGFLQTAGPYATTITFGGITGYCSGLIIKKTSRASAGLFGALFCIFQVKLSTFHQQLNT